MLRTIWFFFKLFAGLVALEPKLRKSEKIRKNEGEEAYTAYVTDVVQNWCRKRLKLKFMVLKKFPTGMFFLYAII